MRKNNRKFTAISAVLFVLACGTSSLAIDESDGLEFASLVPPNALVFVEIKDLAAQMGTVLDSRFVADFPKTTAYRDFTTSKLYNKLADRISRLEEQTGFGLSLKNFRALAGGRSAFALYDIGELRFLFLTKIAPEKAAASALWNLRETFDERIVEGGKLHYYVMEDEYGSVALAFALAGDLLVIGTDSVSFEACLSLIGGKGDSLAGAEAFKASYPADYQLEDGFLFLDQKKIAETPYFSNYWIYGNQAELKDVSAVAVSVHIGEGEVEETRWIDRDRVPPALPEGIGRVAETLPEAADYYEYGTADSAAECAGLLADELFDKADDELKSQLANAFSNVKPGGWGMAMKAEKGDDDFFSMFRKVIAVDLANAQSFNREAFENALAGYFGRKLLYGGAGSFSFVDRAGARMMDVPLFENSAPAYKVSGKVLIIGNAVDFVDAAKGTNNTQQNFISSGQGTSSAAWFSFHDAAERLIPYLEALSGRSNWRLSDNAGFFSGNVISLLKQLNILDVITLQRSPEGDRVVESVVYKFRQ